MIGNDLVQELLRLPSFVQWGGHTFHLKLFINGDDDLRIVYEPFMSDLEQGFIPPGFSHRTTFLWLVEGIATEDDLRQAIQDTLHYLQDHVGWAVGN